MGYLTTHALEISGADQKDRHGIAKAIKEDRNKFAGLDPDGGPMHWVTNGYVKWYDCDEDMKALSLEFPRVLFTVYGEGEDAEDLWRAYYKNGRMQKVFAKVAFDPFDEDKLE